MPDSAPDITPPTASDNEEGKEELPTNQPGTHDLESQRTQTSLAEQLSPTREYLFIACVCLAQFTAIAGLFQSLQIMYNIADAFGIHDQSTLAWMTAGYSLSVGTFILISGRMGDILGYKKMFIAGFIWFSLWSLIAGFSVYSNSVLFIFARVLQGIGPAFTVTNGLALLGATYPPGKKKNLIFSIFGAMSPVGAVLGCIHAALWSLLWFPWAFWEFAIVLAAIAVASVFVIPDPPKKAQPARQWRKFLVDQLDLVGGALGVTALVLFNFAWNQATSVGWGKAYIIFTLVLGTLLAPVFFWYESKVAKSPLIPFKVFTADILFVVAAEACGWACFGIWAFYLTQFAQVLAGATPIQNALWLTPIIISGSCASITSGKLLSILHPAWVLILALICFAIGPILLCTTYIGESYWEKIFVMAIVMPWGMDMSFPAGSIIMSNALPPEHQGVAASLINTIVNYSMSLGLGVAGTAETPVNSGGTTPAEILRGYRAAEYLAIGLAVAGVGISAVFLGKTYWERRRGGRVAEKGEMEEEGREEVGYRQGEVGGM